MKKKPLNTWGYFRRRLVAEVGDARPWLLLALVVALVAVIVVLFLSLRGGGSDEPPASQVDLAVVAASGQEGADGGPGAPIMIKKRPPLRRAESEESKRQLLGQVAQGGKSDEELAGVRESGVPVLVKGPEAPHPDDTKLTPDVWANIKELHPKFARCYQDALARTPSLAGNLMFSFKLRQGAGDPYRIDESSISSETIRDPGLQSCLTKTLATAQFPSNSETLNMNFEYSMDLSLDSSSQAGGAASGPVQDEAPPPSGAADPPEPRPGEPEPPPPHEPNPKEDPPPHEPGSDEDPPPHEPGSDEDPPPGEHEPEPGPEVEPPPPGEEPPPPHHEEPPPPPGEEPPDEDRSSR